MYCRRSRSTRACARKFFIVATPQPDRALNAVRLCWLANPHGAHELRRINGTRIPFQGRTMRLISNQRRTILVAGGAGYIGSHVVLQLVEAGERVVVLDNLSSGFADAVIDAELVVGDVGDEARVTTLLRRHRIDTVMHFAARTIVPESVADPLRYYGNNTC